MAELPKSEMEARLIWKNLICPRDWGCQMDPENMEGFDVDSEEELRSDAMYPVMLGKWQR